MPRTRTVVVDADNSWTIREELTVDPSSPVAPQDDYIVVQTGFPVYSNAHSSYSEIVIWGVGLVSFGPVTAEQTAFMASLGATPDLAAFPCDYVAFGFSSTQLDHFQYGVKDGYVYVTSDSLPMISITPDGIGVFGVTSADAFFGMDFGGYQATSTSAASVFYSDLDVTSGTSGANVMTGSNGPETLLGLGGNDHLIGNDGGDHLDGGAGNDLLEGGAGNDRLYGGTGADVLNGGAGNDRLFGDKGNDLLIPGGGSNDVDGGAGTDRLLLDFGASTASLYFQYHPDSFIALPDGGVSATNVEAMIVYGSDYSDVIMGTGFDDELYGGNGFDLLQGGAGKDLLDGGANSGTPTAIIPTAADTREAALPIDHFFTLNADPDILNSTTVPHATLNVSVETAPFEFAQEAHRYVAVTVQAGATLTVDIDHAIFQIDTQLAIYDSTGALVEGGTNDDGDYSGGFDPGSTNSSDSLLSFTFATAGTYYVDVTSLVSTNGFSSDFEVNFSLTSASVPVGDVMEGGPGGDIYVVHSASDTVVEQPGGGTDTVRTDLSYVLGTNVENLELTGTNAVDGTGNTLANTITGNSAANVLTGLAGSDVLNGAGGNDTIDGGYSNDTINGGLGNDVLRGGAGTDKFVFDSTLNGSTNVDQLIDFHAKDKIVLDQTIFAGLAQGSLAAADFSAGTAAHDATDRIIYDSATGSIYYDADGDGAGAQVLFAQVAVGTALTSANFLIVS